jgi:hypothetical protein
MPSLPLESQPVGFHSWQDSRERVLCFVRAKGFRVQNAPLRPVLGRSNANGLALAAP